MKTEFDPHIESAKENLRLASIELYKALDENVWGHDAVASTYIAELHRILLELKELRARI